MRLRALRDGLGDLRAHQIGERLCAIGPSVVVSSSGLPSTYLFTSATAPSTKRS